MENASLLVLPLHLVDKIKSVLGGELGIPRDLEAGLQAAVDAFDSWARLPAHAVKDDRRPADKDEEEAPLPTIDMSLVESLAKWSSSDKGQSSLEAHTMDPATFSLISLLSGTHLYLPPAQLALLKATAESMDPDRTRPDPFLPSHLSPRPSPFSGYRALQKQLSTALNILFSIFGSGGAVYVAASTGAGWSREHSVVLGVIAGFVVGIAEMVLVWILVWRVDTGRKTEPEMWKGSASDGLKVVDDKEQPEQPEQPQASCTPPKSTTVRLRRRALA